MAQRVFVFYTRATQFERAESLRVRLSQAGLRAETLHGDLAGVVVDGDDDNLLTYAEAEQRFLERTFDLTNPSGPVVLFELAEEGSRLPAYETAGAAGFDLRTVSAGEIEPGRSLLVSTGLRVQLPAGYEMQIRPRSGLALKHAISIVNSPGTIDSDYRGIVGVILINHHTKETFSFAAGDRIAQAVIAPVVQPTFVAGVVNSDTQRGSSGFGSTGRA